MILQKNRVVEFDIDSIAHPDKFHRFKKFDFSKQGAPSGFYAVLLEKDIKLICKISKSITKADFKGAYSSNDRYDRFDDVERYFFVNREGKPVEFRKNKKSIYQLVPDKTYLLKDFFQRNDVDIKKIPDLIKLFEFINSL